MKLTRIEKDNLEFFRFLCPSNVLEDDTYTRLGMITDDGKACSVMAFYIFEGQAYIKWLYTVRQWIHYWRRALWTSGSGRMRT